MTTPHTDIDPVRFVLDEARLLNDARYDDWLALFAPDGHYWVPLAGDRQPDPFVHASIAYEDRLLLATRIRRLQGPRAHSLEPGVRGLHVLQQPRVETASGNTDGNGDGNGDEDTGWQVYTPFLYIEVCGAHRSTLAGTWRHRLRNTSSGLQIVLKRTDLVNASFAHEAIQLFP